MENNIENKQTTLRIIPNQQSIIDLAKRMLIKNLQTSILQTNIDLNKIFQIIIDLSFGFTPALKTGLYQNNRPSLEISKIFTSYKINHDLKLDHLTTIEKQLLLNELIYTIRNSKNYQYSQDDLNRVLPSEINNVNDITKTVHDAIIENIKIAMQYPKAVDKNELMATLNGLLGDQKAILQNNNFDQRKEAFDNMRDLLHVAYPKLNVRDLFKISNPKTLKQMFSDYHVNDDYQNALLKQAVEKW